jgi:5-methyltetrahydropteroyltriglutamate--homocysteine methyltransferase
MQYSVDRILTSHVGSLPRSQAVTEVLFARAAEKPDPAGGDSIITNGVAEVVKRQVGIGLDVVSDGETSKISYATYISERLTGFDGDTPREPGQDLVEYPSLLTKLAARPRSTAGRAALARSGSRASSRCARIWPTCGPRSTRVRPLRHS